MRSKGLSAFAIVSIAALGVGGVGYLATTDGPTPPRRVIVPFQNAAEPDTTTTGPPTTIELPPQVPVDSPARDRAPIPYQAENYPQSPPADVEVPVVNPEPEAPVVNVPEGGDPGVVVPVEDPGTPDPPPTTCVPKPAVPGSPGPPEYFCGP